MKYIFLGIFSLLILSGCIKSANNNQAPANNSAQEQNAVVNEGTNTNEPEVVEQSKYKMEEIAKHGSAEDCWLLINGKVYDVTGFIAGGKHGGGDAILAGCGIDATVLFETRPMGSGTPHSDKAVGYLSSFYIGDLQE